MTFWIEQHWRYALFAAVVVRVSAGAVRDLLCVGTINGTIYNVAKIDKTVAAMRNAPQNISYSDLRSVCVQFFGEPRQSGTSHAVFKTPWPGDPRVNIQKAKGGKAKQYRIRQVLKAIDKLNEEQK